MDGGYRQLQNTYNKLLDTGFEPSEINFRPSPRKKGYHLTVRKLPITFEQSLILREYFGDDVRRIQFDRERTKKPKQIFYNKKYRPSNSICYLGQYGEQRFKDWCEDNNYKYLSYGDFVLSLVYGEQEIKDMKEKLKHFEEYEKKTHIEMPQAKRLYERYNKKLEIKQIVNIIANIYLNKKDVQYLKKNISNFNGQIDYLIYNPKGLIFCEVKYNTSKIRPNQKEILNILSKRFKVAIVRIRKNRMVEFEDVK